MLIYMCKEEIARTPQKKTCNTLYYIIILGKFRKTLVTRKPQHRKDGKKWTLVI